MPKTDLLAQLCTLVARAIAAAHSGGNYTQTTRAQAYADGYMRALLDARLATQNELLSLVAAERAKLNGPATGQAKFANGTSEDVADTAAA